MDTSEDALRELARSAVAARWRVVRVEGEEHADRSWHRVTCHVYREDLPWGAVPLIHALAALSFADARPRGASGIRYEPADSWTPADLLPRLRFERGRLVFDADYVRGRMVKTTVTVEPQGKLVVETRNRHEMALRWLDTLKGRKNLRLVKGDAAAPGGQDPG